MANLPDAKSGPRWLAELFLNERPRLLKYLQGRLRNPEDAQDVLQDAFTKLASTGDVQLLRTPAAYLQRVVRNLLVDRSRNSRRSIVEPCDGSILMVAVPPEQEWHLHLEDLRREYLNALGGLSPRCRQVFLMHRVEERTYAQIAACLGISVATVEYHIAKALLYLDGRLERR